ncbi:hypothetical protein WA026_018976 [Henosepilachna vigintioctopunctata]|uniref:Uncharacterized protein n=1 Tax=Henosepilachna vigintioctopunctata TaxID=420089 RepID=A0AAW1UM25_9CUCU
MPKYFHHKYWLLQECCQVRFLLCIGPNIVRNFFVDEMFQFSILIPEILDYFVEYFWLSGKLTCRMKEQLYFYLTIKIIQQNFS